MHLRVKWHTYYFCPDLGAYPRADHERAGAEVRADEERQDQTPRCGKTRGTWGPIHEGNILQVRSHDAIRSKVYQEIIVYLFAQHDFNIFI